MQIVAMTFLIALIVALIVTPIVRTVCIRCRLYDEPGGRHVHTRPIPRLGGIGIAAGTMAALLSTVTDLSSNQPMLGVLFGGTFIVILGIVDDVVELRPRYKLLGQVIAASILVASGVRIEFVTNPFGAGMVYLGYLGAPLTVFWVVAIINAMNLIDGLDGLAAGVSTIAALTMFLVAMAEGDVGIALLAAALAGGALGFLRYNFNPASIFMGDTGSMFLGFILATVSAEGALKSATAATLLVPVIAMGVPIFDTVFAIIRRKASGKRISEGDQSHLHHRLLQMGLTQKQTVLVIYVISICLGLTAIVINSATNTEALILVFATVALMVVGAWKVGILTIEEYTRSNKSRTRRLGGHV